MFKEQDKSIAVKLLFAFSVLVCISIIFIIIFSYINGANNHMIIILSVTLLIMLLSIFFISKKKFNLVKYIVSIIPPYTILFLSIVGKTNGLFFNVYAYLIPRFLEIIYVMVPVIFFGLRHYKKMLIVLLIISPTVLFFGIIHELFGINIDVLIINHKFFIVFLIMFSFFYGFAILAILFFQRTNLLFRAKLERQNKEILDEKEELKFLNQKIQESEERYRSIIKSTIDVIFAVDKNGKIIFVSEQVKSMFKREVKDLVGQNFIDFVPKEEEARNLQQLKNIFIEKELLSFETFILDIQNVLIPVELSGRAIKRNGQNIVLASIRDISKRKKAEQDLKESERKFKEALEHLGEGFGITDFNETFVFANPEAERIFGVKSGELIGKHLKDLFTEEQFDEIKKQTRNRKQGKVNTYELEIVDKENKIKNILITATPQYNKENEITGTVGVFRDITRRYNYIKELNNSKEKIEIAHKDIMTNIKYAQSIQRSLLTPKKYINKYFKDYFLLFKPKELVSGDFYYINKINDEIIFAVADCTGHGVTGGFITMLGITYLHEIVHRNDINNSGEVLDLLRERIKAAFRVFDKDSVNGLEIAFCTINTKTNILQFAGAFLPLIIIRDNELVEYKATRNPISSYIKEDRFKNNKIQLKNNDLLYMFSDGFKDQVNDLTEKKYTKKRFGKLLFKNHTLPMDRQENELNKEFDNWKKDFIQVDDVTVLGIKWNI